MASTPHEKFLELLREFDTAMLVTRTANGQLRSRPMVVADVQADGTLWFLTQRHAEKMAEIARDSHVNVAMQSSEKFVSLSGPAAPVEDRHKLDQLWNEAWKTWFPGGKGDPTLVLLKVQGDTGEYWDNSGTSGIKYLIKAGQAYLSGTTPDVAHDPKIHAKVDI
jgi:general stress protein 26